MTVPAPPGPPPRRRDRPVRGVTEQQQQTIRILACLTLLSGHAPTLGEMASELGVTKVAVCLRLRWLEKKGLCERATRALTELGLSAIGLSRPLSRLTAPAPEAPR